MWKSFYNQALKWLNTICEFCKMMKNAKRKILYFHADPSRLSNWFIDTSLLYIRQRLLVVKSITHFINLWISTNQFPQQWTRAVITILKSGAHDQVSNFSLALKEVKKSYSTTYWSHLNKQSSAPKPFEFKPKYLTEMTKKYMKEKSWEQYFVT